MQPLASLSARIRVKKTETKKMKKLVIFMVIIMIASACATPRPLTVSEKDYLDAVNAAPTKFHISKNELQRVRVRAEHFVSGSGGLLTSSDWVIESLPRRGYYIYKVYISPAEDGYTISVRCSPNHGSGQNGRNFKHNERVLAHYLRTGKINYDFLGW